MKKLGCKQKDILTAIALALIVVLLTGFVLDCSHDWGDDFAAYLLEGVALAKGTFHEQVSLNYALHNRLDPRIDYGQSHIYVWGYPLLLSLVYRITGYDTATYNTFVYYKLPGLLFLGIFVFVFYLLLRKRFSLPVSVLLTVMFSTCARVTAYTNSVLTEIVFLSMCYVSFFLSEKLLEQTQTGKRVLYAVLLGVALWYTYEVRLNGIMVLLCILLQQFLFRFAFQKKKLCREDLLYLIPYAVFGILCLIFDGFVFGKATSESSDLAQGTFATFFRNIRTYYLAIYEWLHEMLLHLHGGSRPFSEFIVTSSIWVSIGLFVFGLISDGFKKQNIYLSVYCIASFIGTCLLSYNQWIRYIFTLLPLFVMYAAYGVLKIISMVTKLVRKRNAEKIPSSKRSGILAAVLCLCLTLYTVFPLAYEAVFYGANWERHGLEAFSDDSRNTYLYIQKNLPEDCVIQCNKYRALLLNTGRLTIHTAGDTDAADYYMHIELCADAPGFSTEDFTEIYKTDTVTLYERTEK